MITVRTSPAYVNRVRQDWTANGGVYGDGGVYAVVPSNDPFAQLGPTLDLTFAGVPTDQFTAATTDGYSINLNLSSEIYQIAAQYAVWVDGSGMTQRNFADIVTFTRASTATYFNSTGTLTTAAINEARFDYDPSTLAAQGLLIEEQRTNSIRNNTMQGAVAGTPGTLPTNWQLAGTGTLTSTVVGTGTANGITYIDLRVNGTTSTTQVSIRADSGNAIAASNGQTWALSVWAAVVGGSLTNITTSGISVNLWDSVGGYLTTQIGGSLNTTSTLTRTSVAGALSNASVAFIQPQFTLNFNSGVAIDITLRIGLPQLELGAFATSVIPTTTTALTRNADTANINTMSPWYNQVNGSVYAEFVSITDGSATQTNANQGVWSTTQSALGSFNGYGNEVSLTANSTAKLVGRARYVPTGKNNVIAIGSATGYIAANTIYKTAFAWDASNIVGDSNIGALSTVANTAAVDMGTHNRMTLGNQNVGGTPPYQLNGWLRRITYYPRRLSDADLQTITT